MQWSLILLIIVAVIWLGTQVLRTILGKYYRNQLVMCVQRGDLKGFDEVVGKKAVRMVVPPYNVYYMRLNLNLMMENEAEIDHDFDTLRNMTVSKALHRDVVLKAYYYYVKKKDGVRSKELIEEIRTFDEEKFGESIKECNILYDIYILKKSNHIQELLEGIEELPLMQRAANEYLVSMQYENMNKPEQAKEHENMSTFYIKEALKEEQEPDEEEEDYEEEYDEESEEDLDNEKDENGDA